MFQEIKLHRLKKALLWFDWPFRTASYAHRSVLILLLPGMISKIDDLFLASFDSQLRSCWPKIRFRLEAAEWAFGNDFEKLHPLVCNVNHPLHLNNDDTLINQSLNRGDQIETESTSSFRTRRCCRLEATRKIYFGRFVEPRDENHVSMEIKIYFVSDD